MAVQIRSPCTANESLVKAERARRGTDTLVFENNLRFLAARKLIGTSSPGRAAAILEQMVCMNISFVCVYVFL